MNKTKTKRKNKSKSKNKSKTITKNNSLLDNIVISNIIGVGGTGTIYLAKDDKGNEYAYKISKMLPKDIKKSLTSEYWREIDFANNVANKYIDHFMYLYDSKIDNTCKYNIIKEDDFIELDKFSKMYKKQYAIYHSKYCNIKLWSLIDQTMKEYFEKNYKKSVYYDLFIQIIYIVYLIYTHGYSHNDLHLENIALKKTDKKVIKILNKNIQTHGFLVQAIDYGYVLHKNTNYNDLNYILQYFVIDSSKYHDYYKNKVNKDNYDWYFEIDYEVPIKDKELLLNLLPKKQLKNKEQLIQKLYKLLFTEQWQKDVLNDTYIKTIPIELRIPLNIILYIIKNIDDVTKVLHYVINNK
jgi:hypothetical protein